MNNKRRRQFSPEQLFDNRNKKQNTSSLAIGINKQTQQIMGTEKNDVFSWDKLCNMLDSKLKDVAKKEDVLLIKTEIDDLREENVQLRKEVKMLTSRIEQIDRRSRASNIVVSGMLCNNISAAKFDFINLCNNSLGVNAKVVNARSLPSINTFLFTLETNLQAVNVLEAKNKIRGTKIFIQKDYTKEEQNMRYNLRHINKSISKYNMNIKVRLGEFCTYINDKKYTWEDGKLVALSNTDAETLRNLLVKANLSTAVIVKNRSTTKHISLTSDNDNINAQ